MEGRRWWRHATNFVSGFVNIVSVLMLALKWRRSCDSSASCDVTNCAASSIISRWRQASNRCGRLSDRLNISPTPSKTKPWRHLIKKLKHCCVRSGHLHCQGWPDCCELSTSCCFRRQHSNSWVVVEAQYSDTRAHMRTHHLRIKPQIIIQKRKLSLHQSRLQYSLF